MLHLSAECSLTFTTSSGGIRGTDDDPPPGLRYPARPLTLSPMTESVRLPEPRTDGAVSVEAALAARRSVRDFDEGAEITLADLSQLLWATQGISPDRRRGRVAPSAGATYPLEILVVAGHVFGLEPGIYRYVPDGHVLEPHQEAVDRRGDLTRDALAQSWLREAPATIVFAADFERTTSRYGTRGEMYVHMEVGHAAENLCLQAVALGLGTVCVGAFDEQRIHGVLALPVRERPLYMVPVGHAGKRG